MPVIGFVTSRKQAANLPKQYETIVEEKFVEYGPYIPTLVRLLEDGYFSWFSTIDSILRFCEIIIFNSGFGIPK